MHAYAQQRLPENVQACQVCPGCTVRLPGETFPCMLGFLTGLAYSELGPQGFSLHSSYLPQLIDHAWQSLPDLEGWADTQLAHAAIFMQIYQVIWRMPQPCLHKHFRSL